MDGTLTDPREGFVNCVQHALMLLGRAPADPLQLEQFIGRSLAVAFRALLPEADEKLITTAIAAYRERFVSTGFRECQIYPEMRDAVEYLGRAGVPLYVVTVRATANARRILDHLELTQHFRGIYGAELAHVNPDKALLIRQALLTEKLERDYVVMIGDRADDIRAARANGIRAISVAWGYGSIVELREASPETIVNSVSEMLSCLALWAI
jgi:phosphoglycolate phosphatase